MGSRGKKKMKLWSHVTWFTIQNIQPRTCKPNFLIFPKSVPLFFNNTFGFSLFLSFLFFLLYIQSSSLSLSLSFSFKPFYTLLLYQLHILEYSTYFIWLPLTYTCLLGLTPLIIQPSLLLFSDAL
ncbi:hypothetical protein BC941DRAFT_128315 [Chlamydoabsidia padenii]|nr:hypothetical protein BC941DRAFT_128315 [Chlamydoabsidia padenii]